VGSFFKLFWGFIILTLFFWPKVFWDFQKWTKKMSKNEKVRKTLGKMQHL
jgi:hypothetical protein